MKNKIEAGHRLKSFISKFSEDYEAFAYYLDIPEDRFRDILDDKVEMTTMELYKIHNRLFISTDYLLGLSEVPISESVKQEDIDKAIDVLKKYLNR